MTNSKITTVQLVILLFLSRAFNIINYAPIFNESANDMALFYGTLLAFLISVLIFIPPLLLYKRFKGENIIDVVYNKSKLLGGILTFIILLLIFAYLISTVTGFEFFMTNSVYPDAHVGVISVTMCVVCFICSFNGLEGLARTGMIVFVIFLIGSVFIGIAAIPSINVLNIKPILETPFKSSLNYALDLVSKSNEYLLFILFMPRTKGNVNKAVFWLLTLVFSFIAITNFLTVGVLGNFYNTQTFPYYSLTSVVEVSILQRLDSVHMVSWVFISFIRITFEFIAADTFFKRILPKKVKKISMPVIFLISVTASVIMGYYTYAMNKINYRTPIFIGLIVCILPLIMLFTCKKKEVTSKNEKNKADTVAITDDI